MFLSAARLRPATLPHVQRHPVSCAEATPTSRKSTEKRPLHAHGEAVWGHSRDCPARLASSRIVVRSLSLRPRLAWVLAFLAVVGAASGEPGLGRGLRSQKLHPNKSESAHSRSGAGS